MIKKRIITGLSLVLFSFFFYFLPNGEIKFLIFVGLTIKASQEMLIIFNKEEKKVSSQKSFSKNFIIIILTLLFFIILFIFLQKQKLLPNQVRFLDKIPFSFDKYSFFLLFSPFILLLFFFVFLSSWHTSDLAKIFLIMIYIGVGMSCLLTLILSTLPYLLFFVLLIVLTDSFAFLARFPRFCPFLNLGLLVPHLSPKKTKKGAILGTLGSVIATFIFFFTWNKINNYSLFIFFAFAISIISQISDLLASKFKRDFNIKDFGNILPGHGGFLDRFDSWLLTAFFSLFFFTFIFLN
ncbi:phosphatidate cytidylyltransferase [Candidatus Phytoplasma solani]|uniref:phosphatidate cytidylyltransferase n=1 Tax=Candidatus Phytoplasma solani TaxID=69896 RepID=UPI0032DB0918